MAEQLHGIPFEYEPKRKNRFVAQFPSDIGIEAWKIQKYDRPKLSINSVPVHYMNQENYVAGKYKWEPLTIELIDIIGPSTTQQVMEWVRLHAESATGRMGYAAGYKKNLYLKSLDPTGVEIDSWFIEQAHITDVDFGDNDHTSDDLQGITITIQPWRCINQL